jgi:phage shock protein A
MGIFSRFRDIISSNINSMLDNAEDPEKMIKLMIYEMEDTLVEIKTSCARVMASIKGVQRQLSEARDKASDWAGKAQLAVSKGREDLAREALLEKRKFDTRVNSLDATLAEHNELFTKYQEDIRQLEEKIQKAKEKKTILAQRHLHAKTKMKAEQDIRRIDSSEAMMKFDQIENRIDLMEADADLVNFGKKSTLEEKFDELNTDEEIENELAKLKANLGKSENKNNEDAAQ